MFIVTFLHTSYLINKTRKEYDYAENRGKKDRRNSGPLKF